MIDAEGAYLNSIYLVTKKGKNPKDIALNAYMSKEKKMKCKCSTCNKELGISCQLDSWNDLEIEVDPCETCLEEAREEATSE